MRIILVIGISLIINNTLNAAEPTPTPAPFWKSKPKVYKSIKEDRYIAISVKTDEVKDQERLIMACGGRIHAPLSFTHQHINDFNSYSKLLPYVDETSFDPKTKNLFVHTSLLGYHVRMTLHMETQSTANGYRINWESISGSFKGMKGVIIEDRDGSEHTEISMDATHMAHDLGIPAILSGPIIEIAGRKIAARMRAHIESEWEKSKKELKIVLPR
ncbi:MAG: hypothetical protein SGI74_05210 [Oligoflexia bacterium]|nr:hypothetical protein [Oligoflexia bacterium]